MLNPPIDYMVMTNQSLILYILFHNCLKLKIRMMLPQTWLKVSDFLNLLSSWIVSSSSKDQLGRRLKNCRLATCMFTWEIYLGYIWVNPIFQRSLIMTNWVNCFLWIWAMMSNYVASVCLFQALIHLVFINIGIIKDFRM